MLWKRLGVVGISSGAVWSWEVGLIIQLGISCGCVDSARKATHLPPSVLSELWDPAFGMRQTIKVQPVLRV